MTATVTLELDVTNLMVKNDLTPLECERIIKDYLKTTKFATCTEFQPKDNVEVKISE